MSSPSELTRIRHEWENEDLNPDSDIVWGRRDITIEILRGSYEEVTVLIGKLPEGWIRIGTRIDRDGPDKFIAVYVNQALSLPGVD